MPISGRVGQARLADPEIRCGSGNAFEEAMTDARCISRIDWYTVPLTGAVGAIGGKHYLLAITVGPTRHTYWRRRRSVQWIHGDITLISILFCY